MSKLEVGQKLYYEAASKIIEVTINKIGNKYFTIEENKFKKYLIENLEEVTKYGCKKFLCISKQEIIDNNEIHRLNNKIREKFGCYGNSHFSLDQLKRIESIIEEIN